MIKNIGTIQAILAINPAAQVTISTPAVGAETIDWLNTTVIPQADIDAKLIELEAEWTANEYSRSRQAAFPSIGDQLDMQYHDQLDGTTTWKDAVAKVKSDNPKP